jgi:hypothetical protein
VLDMTRNESDLVTGFWISPTKTRSRGRLYLGGQSQIVVGN